MKAKDKNSEKKENLKYNPEITEHDKDVLNQDNIHGDGGDDQELKDRKRKVDFAGEDLDVPGRTQAKKGNGPEGFNDEENKLFSQGGDSKDNLERDDAANQKKK